MEAVVTVDGNTYTLEGMGDATHVLMSGYCLHVAQIHNKELSEDVYKWLGGCMTNKELETKYKVV